MKKIITSALVILATATGFSQEVKWGVKGGVNISSLIGENDLVDENEVIKGNISSKIGLNVGGFMEYQINDKWALQPELLISTQGATYENLQTDNSNDMYSEISIRQNTSFTSINLPIILKYKVLDRLNIEFGPQIGMIIASNNSFDYTIKENYYETPTKLRSRISRHSFEIGLKDSNYKKDGRDILIIKKMNRFDLGVNIGASYDITENLFVQARYTLGLTGINILSVSQYDTYYPQDGIKDNHIYRNKVKNSVFQLGVGYKF